MTSRDTLLSLDPGPEDALYRIQRSENNVKRAIYVHVTDITILPEESRTAEYELIRDLGKLKGWGDDNWTTLTLYKTINDDRHGDAQIHCLWDNFKAHALSQEHILESYPLFNIFDLRVIKRKNDAVQYVHNGSSFCYLKIARFGFELRYIKTELSVYHDLARLESKLGPQLLGYVFEGAERRIVGFLLEEVSGRPPALGDLEECKAALRELHGLGIIHGDPNKYNIIITKLGVRLIDFENACKAPVDNGGSKRWDAMKEEDMRKLELGLVNTSSNGQSWDDPD
ncbi:hypothetical protein H2204_006194 [Knufia peltigerae]|uniref:Protein kinase domain-containing protein n=1 Tax=Knufia peltigerae TaxID=1002370 RepID=A0AA39CZ93_9EURO|nr:hypothetical protein H2204_006194 [Knufia peltigerae]